MNRTSTLAAFRNSSCANSNIPKRRSRLSLKNAIVPVFEKLEERLVFGGGLSNTGPYQLGQGPCCGDGTGPNAGSGDGSGSGSGSGPGSGPSGGAGAGGGGSGKSGSPSSGKSGSAHTEAFTTSANPVSYLTGTPYEYSTDVVSNGFGQPWGVTRNWTGENDSSQFGNGWMNTSQPYLVMDRQEPWPVISEMIDGVTQASFAEEYEDNGSGGYNYTEHPLFSSAGNVSLTFIPESTAATPDTPAKYQLIDASGNITTFYTLKHFDSSGLVPGALTATDMYPQEPKNMPDGTGYRLGAFVSFQDTRGNLTTTQYDNTSGNLLEVDRSNGSSGMQERFLYSYVTKTHSTASADMVSQVELQRRLGSTGTWATVQGADYTYYDGSDAYGRLGDLKTATRWDFVDDSSHTTGQDYYRYNKVSAFTLDYGTPSALEQGPTDDPATTGSTDTTYASLAGGNDNIVRSVLSVVVQGENYARLLSKYGSFSSIESQSNSNLTPYANNTFEYQRYNYSEIQPVNHGVGYRVISETSEGGGCACMGNDGVGVFTYAYEVNPRTPLNPLIGTTYSGNFDTDRWARKTTVTLPDTTPEGTSTANKEIIYTNAIGQVLLKVDCDADTAEPIYYRYDQSGALIMVAEASALAAYDPSDPSNYEDYDDLVGLNGTDGTPYVNINAHSGLINTIVYGAATTATSSTAGEVAGLVDHEAVQQGYAGLPIKTASYQYKVQTDGTTGATVYTLTSSTVYRNGNSTDGETTSYSYTFASGTTALLSMSVTDPVISASQNGSGTASSGTTYFDSFGRATWVVDGRGYIEYMKYDVATGALISDIQDVDPTSVSGAPVSGPTRGSLPTALNIAITAQVDSLGRPTKVTDSDGNITFYAYDDGNHAAFAFPGATLTVDGSGNGTLSTVAPAAMVRTQIPFEAADGVIYDYTESLGLSGTFTVTGNQITLPGFIRGNSASSGPANVLNLIGSGSSSTPQFKLQSLSRQLYNTGGQMLESDAYSALTNSEYLATDPSDPYSSSGTINATLYGYNGQGNQNRVVSPNGTITRTVYDGLGRIASEWVGTADPATGWWSPSNAGNLVDVADYYYDGSFGTTANSGDKNLTMIVQHRGGTLADNVTLYYYDWRDRQVAQKQGATIDSGGDEDLSAEVTAAVHAPITYVTYDNIGQPIEKDLYSGDGIAVITFEGTPVQPPSARLQSQNVLSYDDNGRVYRTQQFGVTSATGGMATVTGLTNGTPYYFAVKANNPTSSGDYSNVVEAKPSSSPTNAPVLDNALSNDTQVMLTWNPVAGATSYKVYWGSSTLSYSSNVSVGDVTNYTVTSLSSATAYYFAVTAVISSTETAKSNEQSAVTTGNFIQNGSFETPAASSSLEVPTSLDNWTFNGLNTELIRNDEGDSLPAPDGIEAAYLTNYWTGDPPAEISQTVTLPVGYYQFSFMEAPLFSDTWAPVALKLDSTTVDTIETTDGDTVYGNDKYLPFKSAVFYVAVAGTHTIALADAGVSYTYNISIDEVQLTQVSRPEQLDDATPTLHSATAGNGSVTLSFGGVPNATGYTIYYGTSPTSLTSTLTVADTISSNAYYDENGNVIATISQTGSANKYAYDGGGRNTFTYATDGGQINNFSDVAIGSSTAYAAASSIDDDVVLSQSQFVYDASGNVIETISKDRFGTDSSVNGTPSGYTATGELGNNSGTGGPAARVGYSASYFDAVNRKTADVNVGTNGGSSWSRPSSAPSRSATVLVSSTEYDAAGRVGRQTDPRAIVTAYAYDLLGRVLYQIVDDTVSGFINTSSLPTPTSSSNQTTAYTYDEDGHVISMTAVMPSGSDSQTTGYVYGVTTDEGSLINSNDLLYQIEYPDPSTGDASIYPGDSYGNPVSSQVEFFTYDAAGERTSYRDRNALLHNYTYDTLGRLTLDAASPTPYDESGSTMSLGYSYNDLGLLYQATTYDASDDVMNQVEEHYDGFGQLVADIQEHAGVVTSSSLKVTYTYDSSKGDRLSTITYPNGRVITYNYASGLDDVLSRISSISDTGGTIQSYSYLGLSTPIQFADGNSVELTYYNSSSTGDAGDHYVGLDRFGRVVDQNWYNTSALSSVDRFEYEYDADSNVLYKKNDIISSLSELYHTNSSASGDDTSAYDGLNRLTTFIRGTLSSSGHNGSGLDTVSTPSTLGGSSQSWSLDALGNWSSNTVDGTTSTRDNSDQNQVNTVTTGSTTNYLNNDYNGNVTIDEKGNSYSYDDWNRLITYYVPGTTYGSFQYDALGRRIYDYDTSVSVPPDLYYSNRWQVVEERDGTAVKQQIWSPFYVDQLIERDDHNPSTTGTSLNRRLYAEQDANYNITSLTDSSGAIVERYVYDPYGNVTVLTSTGSVRGSGSAADSSYKWVYLHQGLRFDSPTGTYDDRNRIYSPTLGRFLQQDSAGYVNGANTYQFVTSNPIGYTDASGEVEEMHPLGQIGPRPAMPTPPRSPYPPGTEGIQSAGTRKGPDGGPVDDNGQPTGARPGSGPWTWSLDPNNVRGGKYCKPGKGNGGKFLSWDPVPGRHGGPHWDEDDGNGKRTHWIDGQQVDYGIVATIVSASGLVVITLGSAANSAAGAAADQASCAWNSFLKDFHHIDDWFPTVPMPGLSGKPAHN